MDNLQMDPVLGASNITVPIIVNRRSGPFIVLASYWSDWSSLFGKLAGLVFLASYM